jgi:hypothetical protein
MYMISETAKNAFYFKPDKKLISESENEGSRKINAGRLEIARY